MLSLSKIKVTTMETCVVFCHVLQQFNFSLVYSTDQTRKKKKTTRKNQKVVQGQLEWRLVLFSVMFCSNLTSVWYIVQIKHAKTNTKGKTRRLSRTTRMEACVVFCYVLQQFNFSLVYSTDQTHKNKHKEKPEGGPRTTCPAHVTLTFDLPNESFNWHLYSLWRTIVSNYIKVHQKL